ncbi:hypothetical protein WR25_24399 [Diploscapter pachys]|uniref:Uncharacterized protein n=1 Tax=Diploscapter pachys TaxID=2018661 RepID=A0A2A2LU03_9BILA|nr:hypothetical protein WR25_24399 [Diploscapter pachys]
MVVHSNPSTTNCCAVPAKYRPLPFLRTQIEPGLLETALQRNNHSDFHIDVYKHVHINIYKHVHIDVHNNNNDNNNYYYNDRMCPISRSNN